MQNEVEAVLWRFVSRPRVCISAVFDSLTHAPCTYILGYKRKRKRSWLYFHTSTLLSFFAIQYYESILSSPAVPCVSCQFFLDWQYNCCFSRYRFQNFFFEIARSMWLFSASLSFKSKWCNNKVVLTWLQLERIPDLFYPRHQISSWSILSTAVCILSMRLLRFF